MTRKNLVPEYVVPKLKEKGYPLTAVRVQETVVPVIYELPQAHDGFLDCKVYYLPNIHDVMEWLRDEKNISIEPYSTAVGWRVTICKAGNIEKNDASGGTCLVPEICGDNDGCAFNRYQQACVAGIWHTLKKLI